MPDTLYLVRHGEVENPDHVVYADLPGFGLSDVGRLQATATATRLQNLDISAIVTSPLLRATQTAEPIARATGLVPTTDPRLGEWLLGQRWAGTRWEQVDSLFPGELTEYLERPDDLAFAPETIQEVALRMKSAAEDQLAGVVVMVSHQDPVQALRLHLRGESMTDLHHHKPGHASISCFSSGDTGWRELWRWDPELASTPFPPVKP